MTVLLAKRNRFAGGFISFFLLATLTFLLFQNFSVFTEQGRLSAFPNVCHIEPGANTCSVELEWESPRYSSPCVFVVDHAGTRKLAACKSSGRMTVNYITDRPAEFEFRASSEPTSTLVAKVPVVGIRVSSQLNQRTLNEAQVQKERVTFDRHGLLGSSWDGRIFFGARPTTVANRWAWYVTAFRPETFEGKTALNFDFGAAGTFSNKFLLDSDSLTAAEANATRAYYTANNIFIDGLDRLGANVANMTVRLHMAVFPHPLVRDNPYRSDARGNRSDSGVYESYRFIVVCAPEQVGTLRDTYPTSTGTRHFLALTEGVVVVQNPRSKNATIVDARLLNPARELRDTQGRIIIGYEPSASLDGRLIAYSGTPDATMQQQGGNAMYIYAANSMANTGWSVPRNLSDMYFLDGPGNPAGEVQVAGLPFSSRFPIAKFPIVDDHGMVFPQGQVVRGSYPWLSPDASEIVMSTAAGFYGARRGTVVVGARTRGTLQLVDGPMNPTRGNPTTTFSHYPITPEYNEMRTAYSTMPMPNAGGQAIADSFENILFSMVFAKPGSWDAFKDLKNSPFPLSFTRESYGFLMSGRGRYAEVPLLDIQPDLLLAMPMNESLGYNRALINDYALNLPSKYQLSQIWGKVVYYDPSTTPDWSQYHQTGTLTAGAEFPYEFYRVRDLWNASPRVLKDHSEGAFGNSVFMRSGSYVTVNMNPSATQRVFSNQQLSASFWYRQTGTGSADLFNLPGLLKVVSVNGQPRATIVMNPTKTIELVPSNPSLVLRPWTHIAVRFHVGGASLFVNGEKQAEVATGGLLQGTAPSNLFLGPKVASSGLRIDIDEAYLHAAYLSESEIVRLSFRKEIETEWPLASSGIARNSSQAGLVARIPRDNPFKLSEALLGKQLFESTELSSSGTVSCASCHQATHGFADVRALSLGALGQLTRRNSPALSAPAFSAQQFWDSSAPTLESQVLHPIFATGEMNKTPQQLLTLLQNATWSPRFTGTYSGQPPSLTLAARALASYVRSISTTDSEFDLAQSDPMLSRLTPAAQRGWRLFMGRANCVACHNGPNFSDGLSHDIGLAAQPLAFAPDGDLGQHLTTGRESDRYAMKTPSLRNVSKTAPYFHDGRKTTLTDVVEFYNQGGDRAADRRLSRSILIRPLDLSTDDKAALVEFLRALDSGILDAH